MKFSERIGIMPTTTLQLESMDESLRNGLWDVFTMFFVHAMNREQKQDIHGFSSITEYSSFRNLFIALWHGFFRWPLDTISPYVDTAVGNIRKWFFAAKWNEVYDFIEFVADAPSPVDKLQFRDSCNRVLEQNASAYRFVNDKIAPVTNKEEINSIQSAISSGQRLAGAKGASEHLKKALSLCGDRQHPDYSNSIKESISAVESFCRAISGTNCTLGDALKEIERQGSVKMHPALKAAFERMFGYTSDEGGIRHGLGLGDSDSSEVEDARFMLVSCSAFVNYLLDKAKKAGIQLN